MLVSPEFRIRKGSEFNQVNGSRRAKVTHSKKKVRNLWIRMSIQRKMLKPNPESMNPDPKHWFCSVNYRFFPFSIYIL
jgi:hypothetical protein